MHFQRTRCSLASAKDNPPTHSYCLIFYFADEFFYDKRRECSQLRSTFYALYLGRYCITYESLQTKHGRNVRVGAAIGSD